MALGAAGTLSLACLLALMLGALLIPVVMWCVDRVGPVGVFVAVLLVGWVAWRIGRGR